VNKGSEGRKGGEDRRKSLDEGRMGVMEKNDDGGGGGEKEVVVMVSGEEEAH
jgi:hypothetical protein